MSHALNRIEDVPIVKKGTTGFDGLSSGEHPLNKVVVPDLVPMPGKMISPKQGKTPEQVMQRIGSGGVALVPKPMLSNTKGMGGGLIDTLTGMFTGGSGGGESFTDILKMLLPLVKKFLPDLLGAL